MCNANVKRMKQVMVYAQLDLGAAINYVVGLQDSYSVRAAQRTIKELQEFTGDPAGTVASNLKVGK